MGYLEERLGRPFGSAEDCSEAVDLARALFAAGAAPGEVRASICEVYPPPRVTAAAARQPRFG
eukprot:11886273-Alexandrium_andersonii.AAC.1